MAGWSHQRWYSTNQPIRSQRVEEISNYASEFLKSRGQNQHHIVHRAFQFTLRKHQFVFEPLHPLNQLLMSGFSALCVHHHGHLQRP
jgi:hypothetical protein